MEERPTPNNHSTNGSTTKNGGNKGEEEEERWPFLFYVCGQDTAKFLDLAPKVDEKPLRHRQSTLSRTGGRVVRILVVGTSEHKDQIVNNLKHRGGERRGGHERRIESEVSVALHRPLIFNIVPVHELDGPRITSDFEAYVQHASVCLIAVDAQNPNWAHDAICWSDRVLDTKRIPTCLILHCDHPEQAEHPDLTDRFSAFVDQTSSTSSGCFIHSHTIDLDECDKCLEQLINSADANKLPPGTPRCGGFVDFSSPFDS